MRLSATLTARANEVNSHQGAEVTLGIFEWVEVARETSSWHIINWPYIFLVRGILAFARHPHRVKLHRIVRL